MKWREVRLEIRKCGNDSYRLLLVGVFLFCGDGLCDGEYMQKKFTVIVHIRINTFLYHFVRVYPLQVLFITILVLMMLWFFILQ